MMMRSVDDVLVEILKDRTDYWMDVAFISELRNALTALLAQREEQVRATIVAMIQAISQCRQGSKDWRGIDPMEDEDGWRDLTLSEQQLLNGIAKAIRAGTRAP